MVYVGKDTYAPKKDSYKNYERCEIINGNGLIEKITYNVEPRRYEGMSQTVPGSYYEVYRYKANDGTILNFTLRIPDNCPDEEYAKKAFTYFAVNTRPLF